MSDMLVKTNKGPKNHPTTTENRLYLHGLGLTYPTLDVINDRRLQALTGFLDHI